MFLLISILKSTQEFQPHREAEQVAVIQMVLQPLFQSCFSQTQAHTSTEPKPVSLPLVAATAMNIHMGLWQRPRPHCYHLVVTPTCLGSITRGPPQVFSSLIFFAILSLNTLWLSFYMLIHFTASERCWDNFALVSSGIWLHPCYWESSSIAVLPQTCREKKKRERENIVFLQ